jgi:predicted  nucleic acid-binding Zn-ribbon protein
MPQDEYEIVPLDPIRSLERKIERLEASMTGKTVSQEYLELVRTNQQVVDDLVKMNTEVINRLLQLSDSINGLVGKLNEFMNKFEIAGGGEESNEKVRMIEEENRRMRDSYEELMNKMNNLEKRINAILLSKMPMRRPMTRPLGQGMQGL